MKPLIFALLLIAGPVWAHSNQDQSKDCYLFKDDRLIKHKPCTVSSGGGAGGLYSQLRMGRQAYSIETDYNGGNVSINDQPGKAYSRNKLHARLSDDDQNATPYMYCFQRNGSRISICHN